MWDYTAATFSTVELFVFADQRKWAVSIVPPRQLLRHGQYGERSFVVDSNRTTPKSSFVMANNTCLFLVLRSFPRLTFVIVYSTIHNGYILYLKIPRVSISGRLHDCDYTHHKEQTHPIQLIHGILYTKRGWILHYTNVTLCKCMTHRNSRFSFFPMP